MVIPWTTTGNHTCILPMWIGSTFHGTCTGHTQIHEALQLGDGDTKPNTYFVILPFSGSLKQLLAAEYHVRIREVPYGI